MWATSREACGSENCLREQGVSGPQATLAGAAGLQQLMDASQLGPPHETQFINDALLALYEKRCRSFQLVLGEDEYQHLSLVFKRRKSLLTVQLKAPVDEEPDFVFDNRIPQPIKAAGFIYDLQRKRFERTFNFSQPEKVQEIKIWLAKFITDDMRMYWPGQKMMLKYK